MSPLAATPRASGSSPRDQLVDGLGRRRREEHAGRGVGGTLDQSAEIAPGIGRAAVPVDQAALAQPVGRGRPLVLGPSPAVAQELGGHAGLGRRQHVRFTTVEPGAPQRGHVPVAAVLADGRAVLPDLGHRVVGPRHLAVGTVERAGRIVGGRRHDVAQRADDCAGDLVDRRAHLPQRGHGRPRSGAHQGLRSRERPRVGNRPLDHRGREVVEGVDHHVRPDRAQRRGAEAEVAHPEALHAARDGGGARLVGEVRHRVDGLDAHPQSADVVGGGHSPAAASRRS